MTPTPDLTIHPPQPGDVLDAYLPDGQCLRSATLLGLTGATVCAELELTPGTWSPATVPQYALRDARGWTYLTPVAATVLSWPSEPLRAPETAAGTTPTELHRGNPERVATGQLGGFTGDRVATWTTATTAGRGGR